MYMLNSKNGYRWHLGFMILVALGAFINAYFRMLQVGTMRVWMFGVESSMSYLSRFGNVVDGCWMHLARGWGTSIENLPRFLILVLETLLEG